MVVIRRRHTQNYKYILVMGRRRRFFGGPGTLLMALLCSIKRHRSVNIFLQGRPIDYIMITPDEISILSSEGETKEESVGNIM
jgi:hypothetical protein